ncbi:MAG TPA: phosphonate ABC transporter ATP-binding protein, partial [Firmicutes bacterium]|nr:phosphonate ABC transporter ATP-binding protein [Bacillota bacterium]
MIQFIDVVKTYSNGVQALKGVNLTINDGEFVAIIGLSGAGKSTLLRSINKMQTITSGHLLVDGVDVGQLKGRQLRLLRRSIGMIFQSFNLVKRMSVFNNVLTGRVAYHSTFKTLFGIFPKEDKIMALESLDTMGILEKAFTRADQLSGGQQQRVALARALAQKPKVILADEPVASLDPITTVQVMNDFT